MRVRRGTARSPPGQAALVKTSSARESFPTTRTGRAAAPAGEAWQGVSTRTHFFPRDEYFMRLALREAELALEHDDVPIGAVIVHEGEVIGAAHNEREVRGDPTAHAEIPALREA